MSELRNIQIINYDNNLFTGSLDTIKKVVGGTYSVSNTVTDYIGPDIVKDDPIVANLVSNFNNVSCYELANTPKNIKYFQVNSSLVKQTNTGPVKRYQVPVRIIGDDSEILNNPEWRAMLLGGNYANRIFDPIYSDGSYDIFGHKYDTYYNKLKESKIKFVDNAISLNTYDINYEYNSYLPTYQSKINELNERLIPNAYFNQIYYLSSNEENDTFSYNQRPELEKFVSIEGTAQTAAENLHIPKENQLTETPPPFSLIIGRHSDDRHPTGKYKDRSFYLRQYLTGAYVNNALSEQTTQYINDKTRNLYYTQATLDDVFALLQQEGGESDAIIQRYPMYARIKFPLHSPNASEGSYTNLIDNHNLQEEVLSYIKNTFVTADGEREIAVGTTSKIQFVSHATTIETNPAQTNLRVEKNASNSTSFAFDYLQMLINILNAAAGGEADTELFLSSDLVDVAGMKNKLSSFRYTKSMNAAKALEQSILKINQKFADSTCYTEMVSDQPNFVDLHQKISDTIDTRTPEVIAYRIQKTGGPPVGDARRSDTIQNTYFFNDANDSIAKDGADFIFYDTQVKYGEHYTYDVFAYMLVEGIKYRYSDLRLGRYTGKSDFRNLVGSFVEDTAEPHCIEFYDSNYIEIADQLLNTETNLLGSFRPYLFGENELADEAITEIINKNVEEGSYTSLDAYYNTVVPEHSDDSENQRAVLQLSLAREYRVYTMDDGTEVSLGELGPSKFSNNSSIKAANKFLADFNFEIEPTVKIVQVPLASKGIRILDNPPMACDVTPYQRKDNSQIIGFYINQESYAYNPDKDYQNSNNNYGLYPTPISDTEKQIKDDYMLSNNLIEEQIIKKESISPIVSVNIYRIDFKPTSLSNFDGNLVFTKDLGFKENYNYNLSNCFYEEQVATNKKYYYLFKFVNANGITGYTSPIQVVELIDDGGYKYATFDLMFETDLKVTEERQITTEFKKLLQIIPAPRHTTFDVENVDKDKNALQSVQDNEIKVGTADDLIWGKKFKFRLTSKKTGKKIDINVKYNSIREM